MIEITGRSFPDARTIRSDPASENHVKERRERDEDSGGGGDRHPEEPLAESARCGEVIETLLPLGVVSVESLTQISFELVTTPSSSFFRITNLIPQPVQVPGETVLAFLD